MAVPTQTPREPVEITDKYGLPFEMPEVEDFVRTGHARSKMWMRHGRLEIKEHQIESCGDLRRLISWLSDVYEKALNRDA